MFAYFKNNRSVNTEFAQGKKKQPIVVNFNVLNKKMTI